MPDSKAFDDSRIMNLVEMALSKPLNDREAYLKSACAGDTELFRIVWNYVQAEGRMKRFLLDPLAAADFPVDSTVALPPPTAQLNFEPGTVLAQRYRIVHLLGRGGMGEVYRADDLRLKQSVALKFLLRSVAGAAALERFHNEVRTARQISHPNVCRVYDVGEVAGLTYLMEYVDGEDLASLLRRIGKLPRDKALEIARKLCAGLAAAHDKGVVHRDLKPANIMLDGQGHVRITDFGIAGFPKDIRDIQSGTPAYMSPEQLAGKEVTARSDIYALGIVLHQLFTGARPAQQPVDAELDPAVGRIIRHCLDPDPELRPATVLAVAAALPGGDPLGAALAAGVVPAPETVANAGSVEGLRPFVAVACLAVVIVGLGLLCALRQRHDLINQIPMENSSEVLAAKAREIAKSFGYTERPVDTVAGWNYDTDYLRYASEQKNIAAHGAPYPPAVYFWYRQSPHYSNIVNFDDDITVFRRETLEPGMQAVVLDSEGRLLEFHARPPVNLLRDSEAQKFEWYRLFAAASLDPGRFQEVPAVLTPNVAFDSQAAWTGSRNDSSTGLRVESAAYRGRPVFFRVLGPWDRPGQPSPLSMGVFSFPVFVGFFIALPAGAALLAWRNARSGRGDRRGAFRLAGFAFVCMLLQGLVIGHHALTSTEFILLFWILRNAVFTGSLFWVLYLAFEPQVRGRAPETIVSWSRLLAGRIRDPMVGGHVLIGIALGVSSFCVSQALLTPPFRVGGLSGTGSPLGSASLFLSLWISEGIVGVGGGLGCMFGLNLISMRVRRKWVVISIFVLLNSLVLTSYQMNPILAVGRSMVFFGMVAIALTRFGVLTAAAAVFTGFTILTFPLTTNWSAWYAQSALLAMGSLIALALYGFVITLAGRPETRSRRYRSGIQLSLY
jgi:serine/threonine protein kinase